MDSKVLADLLRTNLLPCAYIQPRDIRDLKELVRQRIHYIELRTRIKNKIHSVLFKTNIKHPFSNLYGKAGMQFLQKLKVRKVYRQELDRYLCTLELLNRQINELSDTIKQTAKLDYEGTGKAKVATARKLATIIFAMLSDKQPFAEFVPVKQR